MSRFRITVDKAIAEVENYRKILPEVMAEVEKIREQVPPVLAEVEATRKMILALSPPDRNAQNSPRRPCRKSWRKSGKCVKPSR